MNGKPLSVDNCQKLVAVISLTTHNYILKFTDKLLFGTCICIAFLFDFLNLYSSAWILVVSVIHTYGYTIAILNFYNIL